MDPLIGQTIDGRFEVRARLGHLPSRLSQPNTVSVFEFGTASDGWLFMELIRGRTLHALLSGDSATVMTIELSAERTR